MNRTVLILSTLLLAASQTMGNESRDEQRPKIGLVLGGGGALGISHIGVLRVLEEQRVPIDYIAGTSMGAIIGGLYASGMSPDEIEAFLAGLDWNVVMSDNTPRQELYFRRKLEDQRYVVQLGLGRTGIKLGTGMAAGQRFNNLLQFQVQRSATITDFDHLPIPFRAVATDLESGTAYEINHGNLARAMRASMAVPGAFTAVDIDGHLLIDGGIVNNLPVDVVKEMGAEFVIAVDVGADADRVDPEKLKNITGILSRTYAIAQRPEQLEQFERADIGIQPQLEDFSASQFSRVKELVPKGEAAATLKLSELAKLAVSGEEFSAYINGHRRANPTNILLNAVEISGEKRVNEKSIQGRINSKAGEAFNTRTTKLDLMRIYGIGEFEQVLYRLDQQDEGSGTLHYEMMEDPKGPLYLNIGLNLRSDFQNDTDWNMLFNLTRRSINRLGAEWRNEAVIGSKQGLLSEFYQPLDHGGYFFVAPKAQYRSELQDVYNDKDHIAEYDVANSDLRVDFGIQLRRYAEFRVGPAWGKAKGSVETGSAALNNFDDDYLAPQFSLIVDQKDRTYFPREGYYFDMYGLFPRESWGGDVSFDKIWGELSLNHSIDDHTVELCVKGGSALGDVLPGYAEFTLGGPESFSGLAKDQFRGSTLGVASLAYRYRLKELPSQLGRGIYTLTRFDVGNVWKRSMNSDFRYGGTVGIGVDLNFGPLVVTYGIADGGYQSIYFSLGSNF